MNSLIISKFGPHVFLKNMRLALTLKLRSY